MIQIASGTREVSISTMIYITISPQVYSDLREYINHYDSEVSGAGLVERVIHTDKSIEYRITQVYLPSKQDNGMASTEIDAGTVATLVHTLIEQGVDVGKLKVHWHSHLNMQVFHSGTDTDNYKTLNNEEWLVSLVLNKQGDILGGVHLYSPMLIDIKSVPVYIDVPMQASDSAKRSIEALDKYINENKIVHVGYASSYGYMSPTGWKSYDDTDSKIDTTDTSTHDLRVAQDIANKQRADLRKSVGISKRQAKRYEECISSLCEKCSDQIKCNEYCSRLEMLY